MALIVTGVGSLIHVYSTGYMKDDASYARYFAGLSVAKAMIELHGGRIWAESEGRGSRFTFLLPMNLGGDAASPVGPFIS